MKRNGFTLTELLVVIGVIVLLLTLVVPNLSALMGSEDVANGINGFSAAVSTARSNAGNTTPFRRGKYQGTAVVVTGANELRVVRNIDAFGLGAHAQAKVYEDVPNQNYILVPDGVGVLGIARGTAGVKLVAPPFALRFNPRGMLVARSANISDIDELTHYDGNKDGTFDSNTRDSTAYDPHEYDIKHADYDIAKAFDSTNGHILPFERLENVGGVILYLKEDLWNSGVTQIGAEGKIESLTSDPGTWIQENGTVIHFNRYTGSVIRQ